MLAIMIKDWLKAELNVPAYCEEPERPPDTYLIVAQTSSGRADHIDSAVIAVQSYAPSLLAVMELNERVITAMDRLCELESISRCALNSDYEYTDTTTKRYRWQAVFDITYYRS